MSQYFVLLSLNDSNISRTQLLIEWSANSSIHKMTKYFRIAISRLLTIKHLPNAINLQKSSIGNVYLIRFLDF